MTKKAFRRKLLAVLLIFLFVLVYGLVRERPILNFESDDYAAYLNEAFAIGDGTLREEAHGFAVMHPSPLEFPEDEDGPYLVYVWGVPLYLSAIYTLLGRPDFRTEQMLYYQIPSAFFLALMAAVMYLFCRRRFSPMLSLLLTLALVFCDAATTQLHTILTDLPFLLASMVLFFCAEAYWNPSGAKRRLLYGIGAGISLFGAIVIRLNGVALLAPMAIFAAVYLIRRRKELSVRFVLKSLLPFLLAGVLYALSLLVLPRATSNVSDFTQFSPLVFIHNLLDYSLELCVWFVGAFLPTVDLHENLKLAVLLCVPVVVLFLLSRKYKKDIPGFVYCMVYVPAASMLYYTQGQRYMMPVMPFLLLAAGYGFQWLGERLRTGDRKPLKAAACAVCVLLSAGLVAYNVTDIVRYEEKHKEYIRYSDDAEELYAFIRENTPEDAVIAFMKPRQLYLNTRRLSVPSMGNDGGSGIVSYRPGKTEKGTVSATHYLIYGEEDYTQSETWQTLVRKAEAAGYSEKNLKLIFQNEHFALIAFDV